MLSVGHELDMSHHRLSGLVHPTLGMKRFSASTGQQPFVILRLRGISVVFKPPEWEVDAKGALCGSGKYLSHFSQYDHDPSSPVLALPDFEFGFIHRLDVPSSGLILTGTHFEGYALLQWHMHSYKIDREYSVLL